MPQSYVTFNHLWPSVAHESARSRPRTRSARLGSASAHRPNAASTCSQPDRSANQSAISSNGSNAPGVDLARLGTHQYRPVEVGQQIGAQTALVVGGNDDDPCPPEPDEAERLRQRRVGAVADDDLDLGRAEQTVGLDVPAEPGEQRVPGRGEARGVGDRRAVTNATPVSAGRRRRSTSHPRTTSCSLAATGDITGSAVFWSHVLTSHELPRATGYVAPFTNPKYRRPVVATVAGLPTSCSRRSVANASAPSSGAVRRRRPARPTPRRRERPAGRRPTTRTRGPWRSPRARTSTSDVAAQGPSAQPASQPVRRRSRRSGRRCRSRGVAARNPRRGPLRRTPSRASARGAG